MQRQFVGRLERAVIRGDTQQNADDRAREGKAQDADSSTVQSPGDMAEAQANDHAHTRSQGYAQKPAANRPTQRHARHLTSALHQRSFTMPDQARHVSVGTKSTRIVDNQRNSYAAHRPAPATDTAR